MASLEELTGRGDLAALLKGLDEPSLMAQQIVQRGAMHALQALLERGCTEDLARAMLASLAANMQVIEAIARSKGFTRVFDAGEGR